MLPKHLFHHFSYIFVVLILIANAKTCTKSENSFENYLGTKTPYRFVGNLNATEIKFKGCKATKFWSLVRHGTRNPNEALIDKMKTRLVEIRDEILENLPSSSGEIRNSDLDLFRKWTSKLGTKDVKKLTREGEDEMLFLAERMHTRFPNVLENVYSGTSYQFKFTATQRTKKSAQNFASGLFGRNTVKDIEFPEPLKRDPILRFYKLCSKWRKEVSKNPETIAERKRFEAGPIMAKTIEEINNRLGFQDGDLNHSDVHTMYMVCAFETAWNKRNKSPWCSAFSTENLKVIEYAEDLKYYWVDGYGHELTYKQACPAFNDLINFFESPEEFPRATVYFTHSGTLLKMLAHLELYKDKEPLTASNFDKNSDRKWRVSAIDTFGTNLAFVLYDCGGKSKVLTLHQENIIRLPSCPTTDLCDLRKMVKYYYQSVEECAFDEMCDN